MRLSRSCKVVSAFAILASVVFFVGIVGSQDYGAGTRKGGTRNIQTFRLTSFEQSKNWDVKYSMYVTKKLIKKNNEWVWVTDTSKSAMTNFKGLPWGLDNMIIRKSAEETNVLAVKASFDRMGYNYVEVFPATTDKNGKKVRGPLPMEGKVLEIDFWVWGGNFKYRLELQLIDYKGYEHSIDAGWLNFTGWRNIRVKVPDHIPQGEKYIPRMKTLSFKGFRLMAHPAERNDIFYVYFDRMQIQTDVFLSRFDGDQLVKDGINSKWMPKQKTLLNSSGK